MLPGRLTSARQRRRPALVRDFSGNASSGRTRRHRADYWLLAPCIALLVVGVVVVYSISPGLAVVQGVSDNYFVSRQLLAIALGLAMLAVTAYVPIDWWRKAVIPVAVAAIIGSIIVVFTPLDEVYRAHRWIKLGSLSFQVAELIKFALLLGTAHFLADRWQKGKIRDFNATLKPLLITLAVVGIVVAGLQSDLGSTGVMVAMIVLMGYIVGLPLKRIATVGTIITIGAFLAISTSAYRRDRLITFVHPQSDCQSVGYQACQALIAVGSGGLFGLGLGHSVQAYGYLPEASNDSIFAIMSEKFGFLGMSIIIGIYVLLISRFKRIIERTPNQFNRLIVVGVLAWISTQAIVNIGAMIGLLPLKGITLPFISYGGTSLIFLMAALGLVLQISRYTSYSPAELQISNDETEINNRNGGRRVRGPYNPNLVARPRK